MLPGRNVIPVVVLFGLASVAVIGSSKKSGSMYGGYGAGVKVQKTYQPRFSQTLVYEGTVFLPGRYSQIGNKWKYGDVKTGFAKSFAFSIGRCGLFRKILVRPPKSSYANRRDVLIMRTLTNFITMDKGFVTNSSSMAVTVEVRSADRRRVLYRRSYSAKGSGGAYQWTSYRRALRSLVTKVLDGLSRARFPVASTRVTTPHPAPARPGPKRTTPPPAPPVKRTAPATPPARK